MRTILIAFIQPSSVTFDGNYNVNETSKVKVTVPYWPNKIYHILLAYAKITRNSSQESTKLLLINTIILFFTSHISIETYQITFKILEHIARNRIFLIFKIITTKYLSYGTSVKDLILALEKF